MKIKTVFNESAAAFDDEVNAALEKGYVLTNRLSNQPDGFIAELVLLDPPAEPEPIDPIRALWQVKEFCNNVPAGACCTDKCPLWAWCDQLRNGGDPTDWALPEVDA